MRFSADIVVKDSDRTSPPWTLESDLNGQASLIQFLHFTKKSLIEIAKTVLSEEQGNGRFPRSKDEYSTLVDKSRTKTIDAVHPLGSIDFLAKSIFKDDLIEMYKHILERSKVVTGLYLDHNFVFFNRAVIATNMGELEQWIEKGKPIKAGDTIHFVNVVPYARRLELLGVRAGATQNRKQKYSKGSGSRFNKSGKFKVPNGAYYLSYRALRRRFVGNFRIKFDFMLGSLLGLDKIAVQGPSGPLRKLGAPKETSRGYTPNRPYLYPVIEIVVEEGGTR